MRHKCGMVFVLVFVCRIFFWGQEGPNGAMQEINKWLADKKFISMTQSSISDLGTYLTIIAEIDDLRLHGRSL